MEKTLLRQLPSLRREFYCLLRAVKEEHVGQWPTDEEGFKGVQLTIGCTLEDPVQWGWQTGDNSYTGGAYGHPDWFTVWAYPGCNCKNLADDLVQEIKGRIHEIISYEQ